MSVRNVAMTAYQNALASGKVQGIGSGSSSSSSRIAKSETQKGGFENAISESLKKVNDLQSEKDSMIQEFASGERQNVHELMISLQKAGLAMRMTSAVRNKVLEAYKELSRMSF